MCPWQTSSPPTPPSLEWLAGPLQWWFNIITEHDWLWALETLHYTTPCRVLMFWKTRYHLFTCHPSLSEICGKRVETWQKNRRPKWVLSADVPRFLRVYVCAHKGLKYKQGENKKQNPNMCFGIKVIHTCIQFSVFLSRCRFALSPYFAILSSISLTGFFFSDENSGSFWCARSVGFALHLELTLSAPYGSLFSTTYGFW